jgi:hypothetical protein
MRSVADSVCDDLGCTYALYEDTLVEIYEKLWKANDQSCMSGGTVVEQTLTLTDQQLCVVFHTMRDRVRREGYLDAIDKKLWSETSSTSMEPEEFIQLLKKYNH